MSDLTNALIAAKLMNGGGGGGGGLPPIETVETELLNKTLTFVGSGMGAYGTQDYVDFSLSAGSVYTVKWDNVDYTCTAVEIDGGDGFMVAVIGNVSILGQTPDTGEPFMAFMPQAGILSLYTSSTSASHDVVISGMVQIPADGSGLVVEDGEWAEKPIALPPIEVFGTYNASTHGVDLVDYTWGEVLALWSKKRDVILYVSTTGASLPLRCVGFRHAEWTGWYMQNNGTKISFWIVSGETEPAGYFTEKIATVS